MIFFRLKTNFFINLTLLMGAWNIKVRLIRNFAFFSLMERFKLHFTNPIFYLYTKNKILKIFCIFFSKLENYRSLIGKIMTSRSKTFKLLLQFTISVKFLPFSIILRILVKKKVLMANIFFCGFNILYWSQI